MGREYEIAVYCEERIRMIQLTKDSSLYIYGAGNKGKIICDNLIYLGYHVVAFLVRDAMKIPPIKTIPILLPDSYTIDTLQRSQAIVIISITNVFAHSQVADYLSRLGYKYIIYQHNVVFGQNPMALRMSRLYDMISSCVHMERLCIDAKVDVPSYKELCLQDKTLNIKSEECFVTAYIPAELSFSMSEKVFETYGIKGREQWQCLHNKSIFYFWYCNGWYEFFGSAGDAKRRDEWNGYLSWYKKYFEYFDNTETNISADEKNRRFIDHISSRYSVFQYMCQALNQNPAFFYNHPSDVLWNTKGFFNFDDGKNRASFLLSKGFYFFPCRMNLEDYELWHNKNKALELEKRLEDMEVHFSYPIMNPNFFHYSFELRSFCQLKLYAICKKLASLKVDIEKLSFLEINSDSGYFGQHFSRMGARVEAVEYDTDKAELAKKINVLLYQEKIKVKTDLNDTVSRDIVLLNRLLVDNRKEIDMSCFKQNIGRYFITEIESMKGSAEKICAQINAEKYENIANLVYKDQVIELLLFYMQS